MIKTSVVDKTGLEYVIDWSLLYIIYTCIQVYKNLNVPEGIEIFLFTRGNINPIYKILVY